MSGWEWLSIGISCLAMALSIDGMRRSRRSSVHPVVVGELQRAPLPVEDERVFVVKPTEICAPVPAGWESWCPGYSGTECTVRFGEDGFTWFTVAFA